MRQKRFLHLRFPLRLYHISIAFSLTLSCLMSTTKAIISVFTSPTTRGNPAGVVISPEVLPWSERRDIAMYVERSKDKQL